MIIWLLLGSCSDDFLEKNQRTLTMLSGKALISSQDPNPAIHIELGLAGSESFYIASYPAWMVWGVDARQVRQWICYPEFQGEKV